MHKISVILPVYNQERYVYDSIQSMLNQTERDFELIVVDDGSTDRTVEIIESFRDSRICLFQAEHGGFLSALKYATSRATGKWLARMDSDDISHPRRLERQLKFLQEHPECLFVTSVYGIITPNQKYLKPAPSFGWKYLQASDITLATVPFCDSATVFDREVACRLGYDDRWENEKPLWYKLLRSGRGAILDEPLYYMRWLMGSHSRGMKRPNTRNMNNEIRLEYDPANLPMQHNKSTKNWMKDDKKPARFFAAAGDFKAARKQTLKVIRQQPFELDSYKLLLSAFNIGCPKIIHGKGDILYRRTGAEALTS